jgi:hypothetical protein
MARNQRIAHEDVFRQTEDFNEQLYQALRQSPWWMISVAAHVLIFFMLTLFDTSEAAAPKRAPLKASMEAEQIDEDLEEDDNEEEEIHEQEIPTEEPVVTDEEIAEKPITDNDLPHDEMLGASDGISDAPFEGPSTNGDIGIGGAAGGAFPGRGGNRNQGSSGFGRGTKDDPVEDALRWLAAHQSPDGGWEASGFDRWCDGKPVADVPKRPTGLGKALYDPGVTGLAICAFLGAGYTNRGKHPFAKVVGRGLRYLKNIQDPEGCFGPRNTQQYIYNHATAALAMVEAYGMTGSSIYKRSAQRGLDFIALARNNYFAWRYGIKPGSNDTSVSGWMMMALKSAELVNKSARKRGKPAPLVYDEASFEGLRSWLDKVTDPDYGRVGYTRRGEGSARPVDLVDRFPSEKSEAMTAVGMLARTFMGEDPRKSKIIQRGAELCSKLPPTWNPTDGSIDMYYWYYGTLAMFQVGGTRWEKWKKAMDKSVVETQRDDTEFCQYKGSWDPIGPWGQDGGRVYSTAIMAMCLEIFDRYELVFGAGKK